MKSPDILETVESDFPALTGISIDFALMENASQVYNVEATFDWDDVGSWISISKYLQKDDADNRHNTPLAQIDSSGNIVFSKGKKQVGLLGVDNLIVVETDDALLVADKDQADAIKNLVEKIPKKLT